MIGAAQLHVGDSPADNRFLFGDAGIYYGTVPVQRSPSMIYVSLNGTAGA